MARFKLHYVGFASVLLTKVCHDISIDVSNSPLIAVIIRDWVEITLTWSFGYREVASAAAFVRPGKYAMMIRHGSVLYLNRNRRVLSNSSRILSPKVLLRGLFSVTTKRLSQSFVKNLVCSSPHATRLPRPPLNTGVSFLGINYKTASGQSHPPSAPTVD